MLTLYKPNSYNGDMEETEEKVLPFGEALKYLRQQRGLKQSEVAEAAGIEQGSYSDWEHRTEPPKNLFALGQVAAFLQVKFDDLQGGIVRLPKGAKLDLETPPSDPLSALFQRLAPNASLSLTQELVSYYGKLPPHLQTRVVGLLRAMVTETAPPPDSAGQQEG
jgi:transcriptional regulator with XRE-family HTH domain